MVLLYRLRKLEKEDTRQDCAHMNMPYLTYVHTDSFVTPFCPLNFPQQ